MISFSMMSLRIILLMFAITLVPIRASRIASIFEHPEKSSPSPSYAASPRLPVVPPFPYLPGVHYKVIDNSTSPGNCKFESEIGKHNAYYAVRLGSESVFQILDINPHLGKHYPEVILIIESFKEAGIESFPHEVASTTSNTIRVNSDYIQSFQGDVLAEFKGIVCHESTHVWQWTGNRLAPEGLLTGIADYVRLKAGYPSVNWGVRGTGNSWDQGYEVTAYFLEYCEKLKPGFVAKLNSSMRYFFSKNIFKSQLGKSVEQLWSDYKRAYIYFPISPAMPPMMHGN